ncbi:hypothetical protein [Stappia indica]|uniref:hypothetical protein n=1 Tax=Stappia indica TaxID=538381 RepID=UPI001D17EA7E|nr:hypothetical protein [Stappia indica]
MNVVMKSSRMPLGICYDCEQILTKEADAVKLAQRTARQDSSLHRKKAFRLKGLDRASAGARSAREAVRGLQPAPAYS